MAEKAVLDGLVAAGHGKWIEATVSVEVPGKTEKVKRPFQKFVALTPEGALGFCDGNMAPVLDEDGEEKRGVPSVLGYFNYAADLVQRQPIRTQVLAENEGPGKTIEKAAKAYAVAMGIDEAEAKQFIIDSRKAKGLPVE